MQRAPRFTERDAREAIAAASSYSEALRRLGLRPAGGNHRTLRRYAERVWAIPTEHFDPNIGRRNLARNRRTPLMEILVEHSKYHRGHLKERLYAEGLKVRECEMCGQGEVWRGRRMALILDHINGSPNDNRLENLRIVCPNCAATLETHCGRRRAQPTERACTRCSTLFVPNHVDQRFCSLRCGRGSLAGVARPSTRKVERPAYQELISQVRESGYRAVGRRYGVSDNAIRKWIRQYERECALESGSTVAASGASQRL